MMLPVNFTIDQILSHKKVNLGDLCEKSATNLLISNGIHAELSPDNFDSVRDFYYSLDGNPPLLNGEIKGQAPFFSKNAFTFRENQIPKVFGADMMIFVSVGLEKYNDSEWEGRIVEAKMREVKFWTETVKSPLEKAPRKMVFVERGKGMYDIGRITDPKVLTAMRKLSRTAY